MASAAAERKNWKRQEKKKKAEEEEEEKESSLDRTRCILERVPTRELLSFYFFQNIFHAEKERERERKRNSLLRSRRYCDNGTFENLRTISIVHFHVGVPVDKDI